MRLRTPSTVLLSAAVLLALPAPADSGEGFVARRALHRTQVGIESGEEDVVGGVEAWLRVTPGHRIVQQFTVWFHGMSDAEGATLWMAPPGSFELEEVAAFAVSENGSGFWSVRLDSSLEENPALPLEKERVLELVQAPIDVLSFDEITVLRGDVGKFRWRDVDGGGSPGVRRKRNLLRRPPAPVLPPDDAARGDLRVWRTRRPRAIAEAEQGFALYATGLGEEESYGVWLEDAAGAMVHVGDVETTDLGHGHFSLDTRAGDDLPAEAGVETVRDLFGRRIEIRRFDLEEPSLVGFFPRIR